MVDVGRVSVASIALTYALSSSCCYNQSHHVDPQDTAYFNERCHGAFICMAPQEHVATDMILPLHQLLGQSDTSISTTLLVMDNTNNLQLPTNPSWWL